MPVYDFLPHVPSLSPGDSFLVWDAADTAAGDSSQQVAIGPEPTGNPVQVIAEISYAVAPAATTIVLEGSMTDADGDYVQAGVSNDVNGGVIVVNNWPYNFARLTDSLDAGQLITAKIHRK
jgi:hypothetical protein